MSINNFKTAKELFKWWECQQYFTGISFNYKNGEEIQGYDEYKDLKLLLVTHKERDIIAVVDALPKNINIKWK